MTLKAPILVMLSVLVLPTPVLAANFQVTATGSLTFQPANLTIAVGDSVTWTNAGGVHNVEANDGSFRCANGCDGEGGNGNPSGNAWSFTRTFNTPGQIAYFCAVHVGLGMTGTISVVQGQEPGAFRFSSSIYTTGEGSGSATISVSRTGGADGAVAVSYATSNGSATAGQDYTAVSGTLSWGDQDSSTKTFTVPILDDTVDESQEVVNLSLGGPTGGASLGSPSTATLRISDNDDAPPPPPPPTSGNPGVLSFDQAAVSVPESDDSLEVVVRRTGGDDGAVGVSYASADGSATADEDYTPVAGTLSWPDGDDDPRSFTLPLLDDTLPEANETVQLSLSAPTGGAGLGAVSASTVTLEDDDIDFGPCVADAQTLCLGVDGRFKVEVSFRTSDGQQGNGQSVDFGRRDSGLFYFFNPNNVEMLVKVLNACNLPGFQTYWVFFAATTNVEFTLTVIDTVGGRAKQYTNPLGMAALPIQDTAAFATCP